MKHPQIHFFFFPPPSIVFLKTSRVSFLSSGQSASLQMSLSFLTLPKEVRCLIGEMIRCFSSESKEGRKSMTFSSANAGQDGKRIRDFTLSSLSLTCRPLRKVYQPILLRDVTLQIDHIGSFLFFLSRNQELSDNVETLTFINLSPTRKFEPVGNESIKEVALRIYENSSQKCIEASHSLLRLDSEDELTDNQNDEEDTSTLTPRRRNFKKKNQFKINSLYLYYAKGAIIESLKNLKVLKDETYICFPLIRRIWDAPLGGMQSLTRLIVENTNFDFKGDEVFSTRGRNLIWFLLFLPSLNQGKFKIGLDFQDIQYLKDNFDYYNQTSKVKELIIECTFLPGDIKPPVWNTKLMVESFSRILLSTKELEGLDLTVSSFSIPDYFSCLKKSLSSSFLSLQNLKLKGDSKKNLNWLGPPEWTGRPVLSYFVSLQTLILDSDFILSLQVNKDGIPMPSQKSDIDGIVRLADKLSLEGIKLKNLTTLIILSHSFTSNNTNNTTSLSSSTSSLNSINSSSSLNSSIVASNKKMDSVLKAFINEHYLCPSLSKIKINTNSDFGSNNVSSLVSERRSSSSKIGRKSSNSWDNLFELCERKNLSLEFLDSSTKQEFIPFSNLEGVSR